MAVGMPVNAIAVNKSSGTRRQDRIHQHPGAEPKGEPRLMSIDFHPVILAGGRGTRFWPLSRKRLAKQVLALDGEHTMIQQTVARLAPLTRERNLWIITNHDLQSVISAQLPSTAVAEPVAKLAFTS